MAEKKLTPNEKRFCDQYIIDLNGTQAAIRSGYSERSAKEIASRLLTKDNVKAYLQRRMADLQKRTEITQDMVLLELAKIGFVDPRKFFDSDGNLVPINQLDDQTAGALAGMDVAVTDGNYEVKKIRIADKRAALVDIGRHLGMFKDKNPDLNPSNQDKVVEIVRATKPVSDADCTD